MTDEEVGAKVAACVIVEERADAFIVCKKVAGGEGTWVGSGHVRLHSQRQILRRGSTKKE